ncbi:MepB family protein [Leptospira brenneri]|uniref:MepB protein n=1 Tax=Leptospira brenneri TaxID=2023182 RepID=A0A2M9Y0R7_9LEPT|nr:MepB family protein [Leptospira brenneri]PJZ45164.1 MepB protein [Leptospira brenneri]TGK94042.1 MepB protein [Leptospira brenneri]
MKTNFTEMEKIPSFLKNTKESLFDKLGLSIQNILLECESLEYDACQFQIKDKLISHRKAKITPKKIGQFVTLWKRSKLGPIEPFHIKDGIDLFIIVTENKTKTGFFIFTKQILNEKGILSGKREGKRGFRVYPTWDKPNNKQGLTTQKWQLPFFIELIDEKDSLDFLTNLLGSHFQ